MQEAQRLRYICIYLYKWKEYDEIRALFDPEVKHRYLLQQDFVSYFTKLLVSRLSDSMELSPF